MQRKYNEFVTLHMFIVFVYARKEYAIEKCLDCKPMSDSERFCLKQEKRDGNETQDF